MTNLEMSDLVPGSFAMKGGMRCLCCGLQDPSHPIKTSMIKETQLDDKEEEEEKEVIEIVGEVSSSMTSLPTSLPKTTCTYDSIQNLIKEIEVGCSSSLSEGWRSTMFVGRISISLSLVQQNTKLLLLNHYHLMYGVDLSISDLITLVFM